MMELNRIENCYFVSIHRAKNALSNLISLTKYSISIDSNYHNDITSLEKYCN